LIEKEKKKPEFLTKLSTKLKEISDFLGAHEWFAGKTVCITIIKMN